MAEVEMTPQPSDNSQEFLEQPASTHSDELRNYEEQLEKDLYPDTPENPYDDLAMRLKKQVHRLEEKDRPAINQPVFEFDKSHEQISERLRQSVTDLKVLCKEIREVYDNVLAPQIVSTNNPIKVFNTRMLTRNLDKIEKHIGDIEHSGGNVPSEFIDDSLKQLYKLTEKTPRLLSRATGMPMQVMVDNNGEKEVNTLFPAFADLAKTFHELGSQMKERGLTVTKWFGIRDFGHDQKNIRFDSKNEEERRSTQAKRNVFQIELAAVKHKLLGQDIPPELQATYDALVENAPDLKDINNRQVIGSIKVHYPDRQYLDMVLDLPASPLLADIFAQHTREPELLEKLCSDRKFMEEHGVDYMLRWSGESNSFLSSHDKGWVLPHFTDALAKVEYLENEEQVRNLGIALKQASEDGHFQRHHTQRERSYRQQVLDLLVERTPDDYLVTVSEKPGYGINIGGTSLDFGYEVRSFAEKQLRERKADSEQGQKHADRLSERHKQRDGSGFVEFYHKEQAAASDPDKGVRGK